jgi:3-hydroxyisobutyrate dehydrogenase-like beta-hydroxyacid dehydrogenase
VKLEEEFVKIGFVGLGAMGFPMARRVMNAGYPLITTFHRHRGAADELEKLGAEVVNSPAEVSRKSDAVITILPADAELRECILGETGVLEGLSAGKVLIDMTTCTPETLLKITERVEACGARVLDAPVSGGTDGAAAGTLSIMAGADPELLEQYKPLLGAMGTRIFHVGPVGQGKLIKIINQSLAAIHLLAIGEAWALGIRGGANKNLIYDVVRESSGYSRMMDLRLQKFLFAGSFEPGFRLDLMKKDVLLAADAARESGTPMLLTSAAAQIFTAASAAGHGNADFSRAAEYLAELSQTSLTEGSKR